MATFDEIKEAAAGAAETVAEKAGQFAEAADEWASKSRPGADKAVEGLGDIAEGALDKVSEGANAVYEVLKNAAEEATGKDTDGDGQIGNTGAAPGEVKAGIEVAAEAVADVAGKAVDAAKGAIDSLTKKE